MTRVAMSTNVSHRRHTRDKVTRPFSPHPISRRSAAIPSSLTCVPFSDHKMGFINSSDTAPAYSISFNRPNDRVEAEVAFARHHAVGVGHQLARHAGHVAHLHVEQVARGEAREVFRLARPLVVVEHVQAHAGVRLAALLDQRDGGVEA